MATTTPQEDVEAVVTTEAVVMHLVPPAVLMMTSVIVSSITVSELLGAPEEVAPTLATRDLIVTLTMALLTSHKTWCLVWKIPSLFRG